MKSLHKSFATLHGQKSLISSHLSIRNKNDYLIITYDLFDYVYKVCELKKFSTNF